ncbi:hypothetical protein AMECASPLE_026620 [Ameca splendens]|uniref:Uncharacterized protein n=1 Tax=Ameca splendens TaxID=208324 RepID=A0ABV1AC61_9TELE
MMDIKPSLLFCQKIRLTCSGLPHYPHGKSAITSKLKLTLKHSYWPSNAIFLRGFVYYCFLEPVDPYLVSLVGFGENKAHRTHCPCQLQLNVHRRNLRNLRSLRRCPQLEAAHTSVPARVGLVNTRSLVNKTFVLWDFFF